ncbi:MAG: glycosyltransferase [Bacteroidetes bacterium]|nr:glycosyltransferase [Bacteroidota bacterium]
MKIAFIHSHKSFLPEIQAYQIFFSKTGINIEVIDSKKDKETDADVEWYFMGTSNKRKRKNSIIIHEYASASTPPFQKGKNFIKRFYNTQPDYRLFLNEYVQQSLDFKDDVPYGIRDMGIDEVFLNNPTNKTKDYDFIYVGNVAPEREIEKLLTCFTRKDLEKRTILILSNDYEKLANRFVAFSNIYFKGPVAHDQVPGFLSKAFFCINYIPDKEPFNQQTPVKFLEYLALGLPVISSRYSWIENFQKCYGGNYFFLEKDLSNFTWAKVNEFAYSCPDLQNWTWEKQIRRSGVLEFLQSKFEELHF